MMDLLADQEQKELATQPRTNWFAYHNALPENNTLTPCRYLPGKVQDHPPLTTDTRQLMQMLRASTYKADNSFVFKYLVVAEHFEFTSTGGLSDTYDALILVYDLPDQRYELLQPLPFALKKGADGAWTARFAEANISMTGWSIEEARHALVDDVVDAFEIFLEEKETLGPGPKQQLAVLRQYMRAKTR